jgi:uncharacterized membrane protein
VKPLLVVAAESVIVLAWHGRGAVFAAEGIDWGTAATGGVAGVVVVVIAALVNAWVAYRKRKTEDLTETTDVRMKEDKQRGEMERKARRDALDEYRQVVADMRETRDEVIEELRKTRDLDRQEIHNLRDQLNAERLSHAVTKARLEAAEHAKGAEQAGH